MSIIKDIFNKTTFKLVIGELKYNKRANWLSAGLIIFVLLMSATMAFNGKNMFLRNPYIFIWALIPAGSFRKYYNKENRAGIAFKLPTSRGESAAAFYMVQYIYSIGTFLIIMGLIVGFAGFLDINYILNYTVFFMFTLIVDISSNIDRIVYIKDHSKRDYYISNTLTLLAGLGFIYCLFRSEFYGDYNFISNYAPLILALQFIVLIYEQSINYQFAKKRDYTKMAWSNDAAFLLNSIVSGSYKTK